MKKKQIIFLVFIFLKPFYSISQNDFRGVNWGMTKEQVKKIETATLTTDGKQNGEIYKYDEDQLVYDYAYLLNKEVSIYYKFKNNKLIECKFVFRNGRTNNYNIDLAATIFSFFNIYEALETKGFQIKKIEIHKVNRNTNLSVIEKIKTWDALSSLENCKIIRNFADECQSPNIEINSSNQRSFCRLEFNTKFESGFEIAPAGMTLFPKYDILRNIESSDF